MVTVTTAEIPNAGNKKNPHQIDEDFFIALSRRYAMKIFSLTISLFFLFRVYCNAQLFRNDTVIATFGGVTEGNFTREELDSIDTVGLVFNTNKHYNYKILQFTFVPSYSDWCIGTTHVEKISYCNKLSHEQRKLVNTIPINSSFSIESVIAEIDGQILQINNSIKITIDGYQSCIYRYPKKIRRTFFSVIDSTDKRKRNIGKETLLFSANITKKQLIRNKFLMVDSGSGTDNLNDIKTDMQIISFNFLSCIQNSGYTIVGKEIKVEGDKITSSVKRAIRFMKNGDYVYFYNIKAKKTNGSTVDIGFLKLKIID